MTSKQQRVDVANQLIKIISEYGRRFFYNKQFDRIARFNVDTHGKIWFTDDYTGKPIYAHYKGRWRHFSHGGTLRNLVDMIVVYISTGRPIGLWFIAPNRADIDNGDMWGYGDEACLTVQAAAKNLEIIWQSGAQK